MNQKNETTGLVAVLARPLLSRWGIALVHAVLLYVMASAFSMEVVEMLFIPPADIPAEEIHQELIDILEGLAVILIGYGVALEERETLREMAGLSTHNNAHAASVEKHLDHVCHRAG